MEQSQLIELIRTLKSEEKAQVLSFGAIQLFNNGRMKAQVIPLLDLCLSHPWHIPEQRLEKKQVYATLFPGQEFIEGKLDKVMVEAHKIVRAFLLVQRYFSAENEFHQLLDFAEEVRGRGLDARYHQIIGKLDRIQADASQNSQQFFNRQFLLEYSKYEEATVRNQAKGDLNIVHTVHALELSYFTNRLVLLNQFLLQQKIAHLEAPPRIQSLLTESQIPAEYIAQSIGLRLHYEIFVLLKKSLVTASEIRPLFDLLLLHENQIDSGSLSNFYAFLRNLCVLALSANFEDFDMALMLHNLYKDNLDRGYLHCDGTISRSKYMAVANNALFVEKYDWALAFIEKYRHELQDENETHDIYRLNLANYYFRVGRYSDCLDNIPDTSPYLLYLLLGKRLELKSLYELRSDLLSYKLDAFKMFLSRTSQKLLSESQRQAHTDFANLLHQLSNSKPNDPKRAETILKRLQEKKQAAEWRWLLEKAKELKNT